MAEQPPLNRIYVFGYSANDRDYPIVSLTADPRVAGYQVPKDLSACPDKRYPNHVFTGAQPIAGDQRVRHVWEILPSPWVPFTRYDDDLGPVQGRRRSVKNEGQVAIREADKQVTYEAREGSAIVYTELEETWSIATDDDGNSLFPIRDRDFYDPSRGPVQERRQLFVPTGEEEGSLENVNGVITQTSYEPYNEFLSVKIVQTYKVNGPQLIGKATDNDGQLVTVTTQRKGADGYIPPNPTATRTVEVSREDAESLVERIVDTPEVFKANTFSVERPDPIPQKFRVAVPIQSSQEIVEGTAEIPTLEEGEISKSEEQRNKFIKRISSTSRDQAVLPQTLTGKTTNNERQEVTVTETLQLGNTNESPTATTTIESEALGDGNYVITKTEVDEVFSALTISRERPDPVPQKFRVLAPTSVREESLAGTATEPTLVAGDISKSEQQVNQFVKRVIAARRDPAQLPRSVTQKSTTSEGLLATVTETLQTGDTTTVPTATKSIQSEALGDGTYVVTVTDLPKVFSGKTLSVEKPDIFPQKFRASVQSVTEQENIVGNVVQPILATGQIAKSEQQVTEFIKRVSTTSRDENKLPVTLIQKATNQEKQFVTITETLQQGNVTEQPTARVDIQSEAIGDGKYIVTKTEAPEVFKAQTFRAEKADLTPPKFRAKQSDLTTEKNVEGIAEQPNLDEDEFLKSEQQINKFVKRVVTNTRTTELNENLSESVITPEGQLATRTITLSKSAQTLVPSATVIDGDVEELGDGRTVKTEIKVEKPFDAKQESLEKPEVIPPEFRASLQNKTISEIKAGESVEIPSLDQNELSKTIQRITEHKIRETRIIRPSTDYPSLSGQLVDNDLIKVTRTRTIAKGSQSITPSATVSGTVEALGDGFTLKTEDIKAKVFEAKTFSQEKPDNIPVEFRAEKPATTKEFNLQGTAAEVSLSGAEIAKSEQQVNEFVKRVRTTTRDIVGGVTLEGGEQIDQDGIKVSVVRTLADGSQSITPSATVSGSVEAIGDGKTIKTELTKERVFDQEQNTISQSIQIPSKFIDREQEQESYIQEATSAEPDAIGANGFGVVESSAQRVSEFTVRKNIRTISGVNSLTEKQLSNSGQAITIQSSIEDDPNIEIGPRVEIARAQAIGGGKFLKEIGTIDKVFDAKQKSLSQSVQVPPKFFNEEVVETSTIEEGTEAEPEEVGNDGFGVTRSSAQRVNAFTVRKTTTEQSGVTNLSEQQTNNAKQKVTVTSTIVDTPEVEPSATTEFVRTQAIGGGKYVKEEGKIDQIFPNKSFSKQTPDPTPQKFRIELPTLTNEITEEATNITEADVDLGNNELEKSVQQIDNFTKRTRTTSRDSAADKELTGEVFTTELGGGKATITEKYGSTPEINPAFGTVASEKEALGGGKFVTREVVLDDPPELFGQEYDETFDVTIPYTEQFIEGGENANIPNTTIVPRDVYHSRKRTIDVDAAKEYYLNQIYVVDDVVNVSLPDVITNIVVNSEQIEGGENQTSTGNSSSASATAFASHDLDIGFDIANGYSGPVFCKKYIFFIDGARPLEGGIVGKINQVVVGNTLEFAALIPQFPVYITETNSFTIVVESERVTATASVSLPDNQNKSVSVDKQVRAEVINVPPTLHKSYDISSFIPKEPLRVKRTAKADGPDSGISEVEIEAVSRIKTKGKINETNYTNIQTGRFIYSVNSQPFRFGLIRVEATIVEIGKEFRPTVK